MNLLRICQIRFNSSRAFFMIRNGHILRLFNSLGPIDIETFRRYLRHKCCSARLIDFWVDCFNLLWSSQISFDSGRSILKIRNIQFSRLRDPPVDRLGGVSVNTDLTISYWVGGIKHWVWLIHLNQILSEMELVTFHCDVFAKVFVTVHASCEQLSIGWATGDARNASKVAS